MAFAFVIGIALTVTIALCLRRSTSALYPSKRSIDLVTLAMRYQPMLRLLDGDDFRFLGEFGDTRLIRQARSERRAIFRAYLRCLRRDHARVCAQIRYVIVNSDVDRKDLAAALSQFERSFQVLIVLVYLRLLLHQLGIGSISASRLMTNLEKLRMEAAGLSAAVLIASPA